VDYVTHTDPRGMADLFENETPVKQNGYMTDLLQAKAQEILNATHDQPFFLSLQFSAPHWPWQAPGDSAYPLGNKQWKEGGSASTYTKMVQHMDAAIGQLIQTIEKAGLTSNTLIIFTSDNGGEMFSDMGPLSGRKMKLQEGGIRVPAIVSWPQKIPAGLVIEQPIITMDWSATILALAGGAFPKSYPTDGINLMPQILTANNAWPERSFYWRITQRSQQQAMRKGNWKYLKTETGEYLYDLSKDASEQSDLKTQEPAILQQMKKLYAKWEKTVLKPVALEK
jgi:arylsulfatase A-like enzyme